MIMVAMVMVVMTVAVVISVVAVVVADLDGIDLSACAGHTAAQSPASLTRGDSNKAAICVIYSTATSSVLNGDRLVGLLVRRPPRERKTPSSNPACAGIFSGSSHTLKNWHSSGYPARRLAL